MSSGDFETKSLTVSARVLGVSLFILRSSTPFFDTTRNAIGLTDIPAPFPPPK